VAADVACYYLNLIEGERKGKINTFLREREEIRTIEREESEEVRAFQSMRGWVRQEKHATTMWVGAAGEST
jgi:hypothetical protein